MRFNIRVKMFLIQTTVCMAVVAGMFLFMLITFEVGFSGYVEKIEEKRIIKLADHMGKRYAGAGNFAFLSQGEAAVWSLENILFPEIEQEKESEQMDLEDFEEGEESLLFEESVPIFFVLDRNRRPVFGYTEGTENLSLYPIVSGGEKVGWVGVHDVEFEHGEDQQFISSLSRKFILIALIMMALASLAAFATAIYFEGRIKVLARGTRNLASGKYHVRIPVKSGDELGDLTRDFNILAETLEENRQSRQKWVEDISHELKTPLTLLSGELEAIRDGIRKPEPETFRHMGGDIDHLIGLVHDLSDLWKLESGDPAFRKAETDLTGVLKLCMDKFSSPLEEKGIMMKTNLDTLGPCMVWGDGDRLRQMLNNLLQNTLRYTGANGQAQVILAKDKDFAVIGFQDSAPGVPEPEHKNIFKRLYRVEPSRNRELGGTGIGLAICKNIVSAHGGTIKAQASSLGGLWVEVKLPILNRT